MGDALGAFLSMLGLFGGISLIIWTSTQAKIARLKAERGGQQTDALPQDSSVIAELKALKQQISEMHSTSHQFDISFDEALAWLEGRVGRLETKSAVSTNVTTDTPNTLRNGQSQ